MIKSVKYVIMALALLMVASCGDKKKKKETVLPVDPRIGPADGSHKQGHHDAARHDKEVLGNFEEQRHRRRYEPAV